MKLLTMKLHHNGNELSYMVHNPYTDTIEKLSALYSNLNLEHTVNNNTIEITHNFNNDNDIKVLLDIPQRFDIRGQHMSDFELEEYERKLRTII